MKNNIFFTVILSNFNSHQVLSEYIKANLMGLGLLILKKFFTSITITMKIIPPKSHLYIIKLWYNRDLKHSRLSKKFMDLVNKIKSTYAIF